MTPEVARKYVVPTRELVAQLAGLFSSKAKEAGWHMTAALAYDIQREAEIPNAESMVEEVQDGPVDSSSADGVRCDSPTPCQTTDEAPVSGRPSDTQLGAEVGAVPASPAPAPSDSTQALKTPNDTQGFTPAPETRVWWLVLNRAGAPTNVCVSAFEADAVADWNTTSRENAPSIIPVVPCAALDAMRESLAGAMNASRKELQQAQRDLDAMREERDAARRTSGYWHDEHAAANRENDALRAQLAAATAPVDREKVKELATLIRDSKTWNPEGWVRAALAALGREVKEGA